ncbi:hypothetical protein M758_3G081300 [Ceratodon purpureus]|nr:hypothetical protein M758_3G081300 [Ceratodon purpureus]
MYVGALKLTFGVCLQLGSWSMVPGCRLQSCFEGERMNLLEFNGMYLWRALWGNGLVNHRKDS